MTIYNPEPLLKQRLRLSAFAWSIIDQDRMSFSHDGTAISRAGILNRIFMNFYEYANASIPLRVEARRQELESVLDELPNEIKKNVINKLIESYTAELKGNVIDLLKQGASDMAWNMTIQKDAGDLLDGLNKHGYFSYAQDGNLSRGKFMGAVFEEYTHLPYVEREKIFFNDIFSTIEDAIEYKRAINIIYTQAKISYHVIPHYLETDKLTMYNYLVGFARHSEDSGQPLSIHSFRLSKIHSVELDRHSKPGLGELSEAKRNEQSAKIKNSRDKLGTMFISDEDKVIEIEVKFTPKGKQKYIEQVHMRPSGYLKFNYDDIYTFTCPERQAEYYFWKFGKDAEVISPRSLKEKFTQLYKDALDLYST